MITFGDIQAAAARLQGVAVRTPVLRSHVIDEALGMQVHFKAESLQRMGAFKFRGAYNAVAALDAATRRRGVVCFTSGNHGLALARAAQLLQTPATVMMPIDAPALKVEGARRCGANVVLYDRLHDDRAAMAQRVVVDQGMTLIPPYDHDDVMAGQGTAALELLQDLGATPGGPSVLDAVLVCVGGGGFLAGSAVAARALQPGIRMVGAEPAAGNDAQQSLALGRVVRLPQVPNTVCDGQQTQSVGDKPFAIMQSLGCEALCVDDAAVVQAMRLVFDHLKLVVEPSGACALAVLMHHRAQFAGQRVGVMLSGGNVDAGRFAAWMAG